MLRGPIVRFSNLKFQISNRGKASLGVSPAGDGGPSAPTSDQRRDASATSVLGALGSSPAAEDTKSRTGAAAFPECQISGDMIGHSNASAPIYFFVSTPVGPPTAAL